MGTLMPHHLQRCGRAPLTLLDVLFQLRPKFLDRVLDRPTGSICQTADRRPRHDADRLRDIVEDLQILEPTATATHAVKNLFHPSGALAARRALAARFVCKE